ncbi:winged helix-turn-helix transcriptional regulator [Halomonas kalidii]|uniref:Helix-turn-helix domain-containing protein n=1 Tax=Halomonas kalidii TaxID=3043293 RepID=A0ABT6VP94_9GAMM|nr:helix-turn-helix domain-containing protein [Halomonas kalidii]MDI5935816.1 helix-turn-helix domain-containing protein [Halomonas kalidii]
MLLTLQPGTKRFNALMREIGDISKQMLSRTLKHLEQDGFITRPVYPEVPPRVEYRLTELGHSFLKPIVVTLPIPHGPNIGERWVAAPAIMLLQWLPRSALRHPTADAATAGRARPRAAIRLPADRSR